MCELIVCLKHGVITFAAAITRRHTVERFFCKLSCTHCIHVVGLMFWNLEQAHSVMQLALFLTTALN